MTTSAKSAMRALPGRTTHHTHTHTHAHTHKEVGSHTGAYTWHIYAHTSK